MTPRQRILAAIEHKPVDRIPTDIWATPEVWAKLDARFGSRDAAYEALHIDGMHGAGARYIGSTPAAPAGETADCWGIRRKTIHYQTGSYDEMTFHPLAEVRHLIDTLAADGTGYILAPCHNLQPVTPIENIEAMFDEAYKYGARVGSGVGSRSSSAHR